MQQMVVTTQSLFEQGYRVRAGKNRFELLVRNPSGLRYTVNPVADTCNCPAGCNGRNCKHRKQIGDLVRDQFAQVLDNADYDLAIFNLMCAWDEIRAAL